jgi:threonyl-tRNA synthetase
MEFGTVYRYEQSGELQLVLDFTQDEMHIYFVHLDQLIQNLKNVLIYIIRI